ncbi:hypothetical protein K443DRAFT_502273 [Laccaria amethystina LaAM-08-1]|uniref:Unplaced genomic scaffold K443scaffold_50, whole genome shotgun sequence n=1 Tax=Laccaria amethystina LaAM-08-1 TaxID=1095629 RepID=A0A0C9XZ46_9AGAR|nr:hypothetical protein K443DRAFT_502273 [Laccaria amethystina LaAM-08-1]
MFNNNADLDFVIGKSIIWMLNEYTKFAFSIRYNHLRPSTGSRLAADPPIPNDSSCLFLTPTGLLLGSYEKIQHIHLVDVRGN